MIGYIVPFLLTVFFEFFPVYFLMREESSLARIIIAVVIINLITNPAANFLYPEYSFWLIEAGVIAAEIFLFSLLLRIDLKTGAMLSLAANIVTIIVSLILFRI